ncbi:MAG: acyl-[acyl-carrier-protein]--UDP-N-acetylglucosamine O-acyltransferase [Gammaproteobacteria bacterium RIFCSPHIGHO2_12_FULL_37_34]|nr:MAG: acyl-[acyl-carrier-protein]--UDP-N-acetylglucosamine O-acyltransferase [Gammaproteobacteria bacterium RIFCSPHIGHO2_12_FULL_37_34]
MIDQTAIIDPSAKIANSAHVGPYSVIGPAVEIGEGTFIGPHVVIQGPTKIGRDNKIFQFSSIGEMPQDLKFQGEQTYLEIGDRNTIREFCTFNRGTVQDKTTTRIGHDNFFMAYVHVAHDCQIGNHAIFANNASLAGHVTIEDYVTLSGFSGVFQFCRVGAYSFVATNSVIIKDVPPFIKVSGYYAKPFGLNTIGLQRRGFTEDVLILLRRAYKIIYRNGLTIAKAIEELRKMECVEVQQLIQFIETSRSGITR